MLHIDGDIIAYRIACALGDEGDAAHVPYLTNSFIGGHVLVHFDELTPYHIYLSGETNFRDDIAVTAPYKGNRDPDAKPPLLPAVREHLMKFWGATKSEGIEADDAVATAAVREAKQGKSPVICSIDKDFDQIPLPRYNFITGETIHPTQDEATKNLYKQILTGDATDNIIGVEGIGPVAASELIDGCTKQIDMVAICVDQMGLERFCENSNLVYLLRTADEWDGTHKLTVDRVKFVLRELLPTDN